ncbi:MAG: glycosyltransferase family 9 protein [Candidatus Gastranaerophilales bacterium]|nr:glycosyltransferase family 9 protein [Candidatus Gastranaerophilales bacterium]
MSKKILIIRLGAIGDVVHTTNTFRAIKKLHPEAKIHYLTSALIKPLLAYDPDIEQVWTADIKKMKVFSKYSASLSKELKQENFDIIINLQPSLKTRWLGFLTGVKKIIDYKKTFKLHAVDNFWATAKKEFKEIEKLPELKLYLNPEAIKKAKNYASELKHPIIVLNAGGIISKRQGRAYPTPKWIELGNKIQQKFDGTILLTGAKEDVELLSGLKEISGSKFLVGELSLEDSCALIGEADLLISGDSGPLHIATALGVKSIGLFGSMPAKRTGPYGAGHATITADMPCIPCNRRKCEFLKKGEIFTPCMDNIPTEQVITAISEVL